MLKQKILRILNLILFLCFVLQIVTVIFLLFSDVAAFNEIHEINGFVLVGLVLFHFILNWQWIMGYFKKK